MEKINIAVLGLGGMGKTHIEAAKESPYAGESAGMNIPTAKKIFR